MYGEWVNTSFWGDCWASNAPLKDLFPSLYDVSLEKHSSVAQMGWFDGGVWRWALCWELALNQQQ